MAYIGRQLARGENRLFDDISSSFNGSTTTFNLTVASVATSTATPYQLFVSLGGVMQKPGTDFTTAGNQITFTTAPAAGISCWIMMQGDSIDQAAIPDGVVTASKIANSGDFAFPADIRLKDGDGSHYVGFEAPTTVSANKVWTLPAADGSANQLLTTNGSGVLTWSTVAAGGTTVTNAYSLVSSNAGSGGSYVVSLGEEAGENLNTLNNYYNISIGNQAGYTANVNWGHIYIGKQAGKFLTGGNICIGYESGVGVSGSSTASSVTAIGKFALKAITTGGPCVALGSYAGWKLTSGINNVIIGDQSGYNVTTGASNTFLGEAAGHSTTTGTDNICIGKYAYGPTTGANNILIGTGSTLSAQTVSNQITLGNSSISTLRCQVTSISALSDRRDKTDINTLDLGLNFINALNPVKFKWNSREGILKDGSYEAGFIAQDFQESQKDFNAEYLNLVLDTNPEKLEAAPGKLMPIVVQAIKELLEEVTTLKTKVALLESA